MQQETNKGWCLKYYRPEQGGSQQDDVQAKEPVILTKECPNGGVNFSTKFTP